MVVGDGGDVSDIQSRWASVNDVEYRRGARCDGFGEFVRMCGVGVANPDESCAGEGHEAGEGVAVGALDDDLVAEPVGVGELLDLVLIGSGDARCRGEDDAAGRAAGYHCRFGSCDSCEVVADAAIEGGDVDVGAGCCGHRGPHGR